MRRLVVATHNLKKGGEMVTILSDGLPGWEVLTLQDFPGAPEPAETGLTYEENARIKAESATKFTGELCIADDAGLEINYLDGAPGLYSKRFGGEDLPFPQKISLILEKLQGVPKRKREARFFCAVAIAGPDLPKDEEAEEAVLKGLQSAFPDPSLLMKALAVHGPRIFTATCEGEIAERPSGAGGFGYDPIFFLPELNRCMADLSAEEKHQISHRGKVLRDAIAFLKTTFPTDA